LHPEEGPVAAVAAALAANLGDAPETAMVLGSGLGVLTERVTVRASVSSADLGLPQSTVAGHAGRVLVGELGGTPVAVVSGRVHLYEGYTPNEVVRYVRALQRWGVKRLLLTCSAGGVTDGFSPGTLCLITDHINHQGQSPLVGPQWGGTRFPDMGTAYDPAMRATLASCGAELGISLRGGVYIAMLGPAYETPAEIHMARALGADLVGMSTVPEVLAAVESGLTVAALSVVSNFAAGITDQPLSHEEVSEIAGQVGEQVARLFEAAVPRFAGGGAA